MANLVSDARVAQSSTLAALAQTNPAYLSSLISAASAAVVKFCNRDFALSSYTEYHSGGIYVREPILLRQFPATEITRVAVAARALQITNGDTTTNQRALVETTATSMVLTRVASAVKTPTPLLYATYPTLNSLVTAIAALGNGWTASALSGSYGSYGLWPSADLKPLQGAVTAFGGGVSLELYEDVQNALTNSPLSMEWDNSTGTAWRLDEETSQLYGRFPRGQMNLRIDYTAGYSTIPQDVQEGVVQLAQWLYTESATNQSIKAERLGDASRVINDEKEWPLSVRMLIGPYRDPSRAINRG